jgi:hypothetical protein
MIAAANLCKIAHFRWRHFASRPWFQPLGPAGRRERRYDLPGLQDGPGAHRLEAALGVLHSGPSRDWITSIEGTLAARIEGEGHAYDPLLLSNTIL